MQSMIYCGRLNQSTVGNPDPSFSCKSGKTKCLTLRLLRNRECFLVTAINALCPFCTSNSIIAKHLTMCDKELFPGTKRNFLDLIPCIQHIVIDKKRYPRKF